MTCKCKHDQAHVATSAADCSCNIQVHEYDPNQPRDEAGRWTDAGGGGSGGGSAGSGGPIGSSGRAPAGAVIKNPGAEGVARGIREVVKADTIDSRVVRNGLAAMMGVSGGVAGVFAGAYVGQAAGAIIASLTGAPIITPIGGLIGSYVGGAVGFGLGWDTMAEAPAILQDLKPFIAAVRDGDQAAAEAALTKFGEKYRDNQEVLGLFQEIAVSPVLTAHRIRVNLGETTWREEMLDGRRNLVVPVVMAKADIVMNSGMLPAEEFVPVAWDGIPVTVGHPQTEDGFIPASSSPKVHEQWVVGKLFGSKTEGLSLKSEAWIDIDKAERTNPGLIESLKNPQTKMQVSTGFFSADRPEEGSVGGRPYKVVNRNIRPNHLALLPHEDGACTWEDGCGVRVNKETEIMVTKAADKPKGVSEAVKSGLETLRSALGIGDNVIVNSYVAEDEGERRKMFTTLNRLFANERGADDDRRQMIADLISNDDTPYLPDDEDGLRMMSQETLKKMRAMYNAKSKANAKDEDKKKEEDKEGLPPFLQKANQRTPTVDKGAMTITAGELQKLITNTVKEAVGNIITPEQRAALKLAENSAKDHRAKLIDKLVANTSIERKVLESYDIGVLETFAAGVSAQPDYSGRRLAVNSEALSKDEGVKVMAPPSSFRANKALQN